MRRLLGLRFSQLRFPHSRDFFFVEGKDFVGMSGILIFIISYQLFKDSVLSLCVYPCCLRDTLRILYLEITLSFLRFVFQSFVYILKY